VSKRIAEKLIKRVEIRIGGKDWPVVIDHDVLIECEALTGLNVLTGEVNMARPSATLIRAMLYLVLKGAGAKYTLQEVGKFISPKNIVVLQTAFITAWDAAMAEPEPEENPTTAVE
jgi:hypothetical protein